jgi:hypothetical protein
MASQTSVHKLVLLQETQFLWACHDPRYDSSNRCVHIFDSTPTWFSLCVKTLVTNNRMHIIIVVPLLGYGSKAGRQ